MSDAAKKMNAELKSLGYRTEVRPSSQGPVVEFDYEVETGSYKGQVVRLGISIPESGYPEYPPHWIHVSPPVDDGLGGAVQSYTTGDGRKWMLLSRPPNDLWDGLPERNMQAYLSGHIRKFWRQL